jgi:hypothetical protein
MCCVCRPQEPCHRRTRPDMGKPGWIYTRGKYHFSMPPALLPQHSLGPMWHERLRRLKNRLQGRRGKQNSVTLALPKPLAYHDLGVVFLSPGGSMQTPSFDAMPSSPFTYAHDFNVDNVLAFESKAVQYNVFRGQPTASGELSVCLLIPLALSFFYRSGAPGAEHSL